jgi:hypothetical protein
MKPLVVSIGLGGVAEETHGYIFCGRWPSSMKYSIPGRPEAALVIS